MSAHRSPRDAPQTQDYGNSLRKYVFETMAHQPSAIHDLGQLRENPFCRRHGDPAGGSMRMPPSLVSQRRKPGSRRLSSVNTAAAAGWYVDRLS